jgi:hypothetical protein
VGSNRPQIEAVIGDACLTSNNATLNVALQAAADAGAAGNFQPSTWTTLGETGPITAANLTAGQVVARFPFLPAFPDNLQPRYLRILFQVPSATNFTQGTISSAIVTMMRDDLNIKNAASNYRV